MRGVGFELCGGIEEIRFLNSVHGVVVSPPYVITSYGDVFRFSAIYKMHEILAFEDWKVFLLGHEVIDLRFFVCGLFYFFDKLCKKRVWRDGFCV